jgi:hypothetical protein
VPAEFGLRERGTLRKAGDGSWRLQTATNEWRVHVAGDIPEDRLVGVERWWLQASIERHFVVITPVEAEEIREIRRSIQLALEQFILENLGPRPVGGTSIEQKVGLMEQAKEIERLSCSQDPSAWAVLASCWRVRALRPMLLPVYRRIGWHKMVGLVRRVDGWPDGLVDVVEANYASATAVVRHRPWRADDYLLRSNK